MEAIWLRIKDLLSLSTRQAFILAVICWSLLVLPQGMRSRIGFEVLWPTIRPGVALLAIISTVWLIAVVAFESGVVLKTKVGSLYTTRKQSAAQVRTREARSGRQRRMLADLSPTEKAYLKKYMQSETTTLTFNFSDGVVQGLCAKGILYRPSSVSRGLITFDFNLQPWAYRALKEDSSILEGVQPVPDRDEDY